MTDQDREAALAALERISFNETLGQHYSNGCLCRDVQTIKAALELSARAQPAQQCTHRVVDARNSIVKSGYMCVDCGALFAAADHGAQPATITTELRRLQAELETSKVRQEVSGANARKFSADAERLEASNAELLKALKDMCAEFRGHDLPYGSKAYDQATKIIAKHPI